MFSQWKMNTIHQIFKSKRTWSQQCTGIALISPAIQWNGKISPVFIVIAFFTMNKIRKADAYQTRVMVNGLYSKKTDWFIGSGIAHPVLIPMKKKMLILYSKVNIKGKIRVLKI